MEDKTLAYLGAAGHFAVQSRQSAMLAEQKEKLTRQNELIEEQNRVLLLQQRTNETLEQIAKARLALEENRLHIERLDREARGFMARRVKSARQTMAALNQELDSLDKILT